MASSSERVMPLSRNRESRRPLFSRCTGATEGVRYALVMPPGDDICHTGDEGCCAPALTATSKTENHFIVVALQPRVARPPVDFPSRYPAHLTRQLRLR